MRYTFYIKPHNWIRQSNFPTKNGAFGRNFHELWTRLDWRKGNGIANHNSSECDDKMCQKLTRHIHAPRVWMETGAECFAFVFIFGVMASTTMVALAKRRAILMTLLVPQLLRRVHTHGIRWHVVKCYDTLQAKFFHTIFATDWNVLDFHSLWEFAKNFTEFNVLIFESGASCVCVLCAMARDISIHILVSAILHWPHTWANCAVQKNFALSCRSLRWQLKSG